MGANEYDDDETDIHFGEGDPQIATKLRADCAQTRQDMRVHIDDLQVLALEAPNLARALFKQTHTMARMVIARRKPVPAALRIVRKPA